ncbi:hypothetical protein O181_052023 [Austropuccinia psidii MF-1]|uniref:Uncharacterized protein n=1 Tax=Austropuccinia psidii MF-1 TaxID=1389203 RepID=A0A9Q3E4Q8_9BASI|nr:hypothetical protein [Austropuccinia psidii MF-1]
MLSNKHTRDSCLLSNPSDHADRGVPDQDTLVRTPLLSMMMKALPSGNERRDPEQADGNDSRKLAQSPQVSICPPPLLGHHLMVPSLFDRSEVIIQPMKDGDGKRTFELGLIVTMSYHPWDSNAKVKPNQPNPPQQDSTIPSWPCKQTPRQPTPGLSGTQWLEDLFHGKQPEFHLVSTFDSSELTVPPFVEPSQTDEPPIPGPSPSSKPHEDILTHEPEPEVAPTQSMEEPFACPTPPHSVITIDHTPVGCLPPSAPENPGAKLPSFPR